MPEAAARLPLVRFLVLGFVCAGVGIEWGVTSHAFDKAVAGIDTIYDSAIPSVVDLAELGGDLESVRNEMRHVLAQAPTEATRRATEARVHAILATMKLHAADYEKLPGHPEDPERHERLDRSLQRLAAAVDTTIAEPVYEARRKIAFEEYVPAADATNESILELVRMNARMAERSARTVARAHDEADEWSFLSLLTFVLVLAGAGGVGILRHGRFEHEQNARIEELDAFAARVAHDLKGPLSVIKLGLGLLHRKRAELSSAVASALDRTESSTERMGTLIDGLLAFARAGAHPEAGAASSVDEVARNIEASLKPMLEAQRADLRLELEPGLRVAASAAVLGSILENLVTNAILHLGDASVRAVVLRGVSERDARTVLLEVRDTGPGIPADVQRRLFKPFQRGETSAPGHGLGLATVKRLAEGHEGSIECESWPGTGARSASVCPPRRSGNAATSLTHRSRSRVAIETLPALKDLILGLFVALRGHRPSWCTVCSYPFQRAVKPGGAMRFVATTFAFVLAAAATALAAPSGPNGTYKWTGTLDGSFTGTMELDGGSTTNLYTAKAHETRGSAVLDWQGSAVLSSGCVVTINRLDSVVTPGVVGALTDPNAPSATASHQFVAVFDPTFTKAAVRIYAIDMTGKATQAGTGNLDNSQPPLGDKVPGDMLALAQTTLDNLLHKPVSASDGISFLNYAEVGVKVGAQILPQSSETPAMLDGDRTFIAAGKGEPVWVETQFQGGPTVSWSSSIPVLPAAGLSLDYGFSVGALVHYLCDDQYTEPAGFSDTGAFLKALEALPEETFALPLSVETAQKLPEGSHRLLDGNGSLAISGGLAVGSQILQLGILQGNADIDVSAGLGIHWSLTGDLQVEVTREGDHNARVKWTRTTSSDFGPQASLVVGLALDSTAQTNASTIVTNYTSSNVSSNSTVTSTVGKVVTAIINSGQNYTQVSFTFSADWSNTNQLATEALYDLSNPKVKTFYEAAVRGNMAASQDLGADGPASGVIECKVTSTLTDALATNTSINVFKLLSYSHTTRKASVLVDVKSADGTQAVTKIQSYDESTNHLFGGTDSLDATSTDTTVTKPNAKPVEGQTVSFKGVHVDDSADAGDVTNDIYMASLSMGSAATADLAKIEPSGNPKYGKTTETISITLGQNAMTKILGTDQNTFLAAYAPTFCKNYSWTPARVQYLSHVSLVQQKNASSQQEADREEAWDLREATTIYGYIAKAQKSSATPAQKLKAFPNMAEENDYNMRAITTMAEIAGGQDVQVTFSLQGNNLNFTKTVGSFQALPKTP